MSMAAQLWLADRPLLLASGSATRRKMLLDAAIPVEVLRVSVDEPAIAARLEREGATPARIAKELARAKAEAAIASVPNRLILAADQTLDHAGKLGMKSPDHTAARAALLALRGASHQLHSAACLALNGEVIWEGCDTATLSVRPFSEAFADAYLAAMGDAVLETVGGYQLEALGIHLFDRIDGDHATILGLPLRVLLDALRALGFLLR